MTDPLRDIAALRAVMAAIEDRLDEVIDNVPARNRDMIPNAFLNLAVAWMLAGEGTAVTVSILQRLAALISSGRGPQGDGAISLTRSDA
jgi:hypothetical protein